MEGFLCLLAFKAPLFQKNTIYLIAFIILHIGGVLWSEFTNQKGIISKIVSGNKNTTEIKV